MEFKHVPVLPEECVGSLNIKDDGIYVDGTLGGAGHALCICERLSENGTLVGIDKDIDAIEIAKKRIENCRCGKHLYQSDFSDVKNVLKKARKIE